MPNWAFGYVNVTGTRGGIKSFIERFVSEDDPSTIPDKRFFAPVSYTHRWISAEFS